MTITREQIERLKALHSAVPTLAGDWVPCENGAVGCGHISEEQDEETGYRYAVACQHVVCGSDDRYVRDYIADLHNAFPALIEAAERAERYEKALQSIAEYWNGSPNDSAMLDACQRNADYAKQVLEGATP